MIMFAKKLFLVLFILVIAAGCGSSYKKLYPEGMNLQPLPETAEVYLTKDPAPTNCRIIKIADLKVASKTYSSSTNVIRKARQMARAKGGNAVLDFDFWVAPNGFAFAAPQASGIVVSSDLKCLKKYTSEAPENRQ